MKYMVDKERLLRVVIDTVKQEIDSLNAAYEHARETSIVSATRMQSRYDTMGVEAAWKADNLARNIREKNQAIEYLERVPLPANPAKAAVGTIVAIGREGGEPEEFYFILPAGGGQRIPAEELGTEVLTVTFQAPLAQELVGRTVGTVVSARPGRPDQDVILTLL